MKHLIESASNKPMLDVPGFVKAFESHGKLLKDLLLHCMTGILNGTLQKLKLYDYYSDQKTQAECYARVIDELHEEFGKSKPTEETDIKVERPICYQLIPLKDINYLLRQHIFYLQNGITESEKHQPLPQPNQLSFLNCENFSILESILNLTTTFLGPFFKHVDFKPNQIL